MRPARLLSLALAAAVLTGCPEERPDAKRPLPRDRFPPAMPVQPRRDHPPSPPGATATPSADASHLPAATPPPRDAQPTPAATPPPDGGVRPAPTR